MIARRRQLRGFFAFHADIRVAGDPPVDFPEKISRSTASAVPPGTRAASAQGSSRLPSARNSALSRPWALVRSTDLKELLQTSSPSLPVRWAAVGTRGRIS